MHVSEIGINADHIGSRRPLAALQRELTRSREAGFRLVEIDITPFHLIVGGEIHRPSLDGFLAVTRSFDLSYTVHGLLRLNLAYDERHELCTRIMRHQIDLCREIGSPVLVIHSGLQALDELRHGVRLTPLGPEELASGARREVATLRALAPLAKDCGVTICMENGDTHQWEHELIARQGLPRDDLSAHHARIHIPPIARQLEAIDHPAVGMTVDVGHLYIAACDMGFDPVEAAAQAAPWVKHVHVSDNFGLLDRGFDSEADRWAFGEADLHMPPGWGAVPYRDLFARWPDYRGRLVIELKPPFFDYAAQGLEKAREIVERP